MGYCDIGHVQAHNPTRRYSAQTTPSTEQVLSFITTRAAELDVMLLDRGISVPVTTAAPASYAWLTAVNAYGAAADAEAAMFPASMERDETPHVAYLRRRWEEMTTALRDGAISLQDAPRLPDSTGSRGPRGLKGSDRATAWFRRESLDYGAET